MYKEKNWSTSLLVLWLSMKTVFLFSRHVVKDLKHWKKQMYCPCIRWLTFSNFGHYHCIFKWHLTLGGLRMAWKGQQINWQKESYCMVKLFYRPAGFLVEELS